MSAPTRTEQARSAQRRAQLLAGAVRLLLGGGIAAVTHRGVAQAANASPGSVRYHFDTRGDLLAACVDEIERTRSLEAERIIDKVSEGGPFDRGSVARMLLGAYYGPTMDDHAITGTFWSIIDCGRESPELGQLLGKYRQTATRQLERILSACGYQTLQPSLVAAVLDGSVLTATVESLSPVAESAVADLAAILRMAEA
ncbi:MAG: TetR/AcrR family transcriptional regulator [Rhodococcus sp.]|nr:TetR/AcrR family transcriptional regulator [Rhodococcus sp. (in: high G+C Gram-positive bacteria)]